MPTIKAELTISRPEKVHVELTFPAFLFIVDDYGTESHRIDCDATAAFFRHVVISRGHDGVPELKILPVTNIADLPIQKMHDGYCQCDQTTFEKDLADCLQRLRLPLTVETFRLASSTLPEPPKKAEPAH